jgi:hypothetical protein
MRCAIRAGVAGVLFLAAVCYGYGGFEVTAGFVDFKGLNRDLTYLNQAAPPQGWHGRDSFSYRAPLWWYGGHGGGQVGIVTLGGSGAVAGRANHADSLGSELAALRGNFEVGYPYSPVGWLCLRTCLEIGGAGCVIYAHSIENGVVLGNFSANFKRWYSAWIISAAPGVEAMGTLPGSQVGLFVKTSYVVPVAGPQWLGDQSPPAFSLRGFSIQIGLRFGKTVQRAQEEDENWLEP